MRPENTKRLRIHVGRTLVKVSKRVMKMYQYVNGIPRRTVRKMNTMASPFAMYSGEWR